MVQIIKRAQDPSERIGPMLGSLGESAAGAFDTYKRRKEHEALEKQFGSKLSSNPDIQKVQIAEMLKGSLRQQEEQGSQFLEDARRRAIEDRFGQEAADLYSSASEGGKTMLMKHLLENEKRYSKFNEKYPEIDEESVKETPISEIEEEITVKKPKTLFKNKLQKHIQSSEEGLLPQEKIALGKQRYESNLKSYQEAGTKLRSFSADKARMDVLKTLNESKKLPQVLGRLNIDKEGNLKYPYLANPETQRFVKTINEFSQNAKDTFGSRVTNFDLAQYLKRFPTLMNTEEGRKQIIQQMEIVNQINSEYYKNLKKVYDEAGGIRNIDGDAAEMFAQELSEPKVQELSSKFKEIGQFTSLPDPSEFKGKKIRDVKTGEILISDGIEWLPQE